MRRAALLAVFALAACGPPAPTVAPRPEPQDLTSCNGGPYLGLIGQDEDALLRTLILRQVRVIRPGDTVEEDLRPARLNFEIDAASRIARIFCG